MGLLVSLVSAQDFEFDTDESDWSVFPFEESDWSALRAAAVAILAWAAVLAAGAWEGLGCSLQKNRLPGGKSFVSSLSVKAPSLTTGDLLGAEDESSPVSGSEGLGGEWNFTKASPYLSVCGEMDCA